MKNLRLLTLLLIGSVSLAIGQKPKFKDVSKAELEQTFCAYDSTANAEYFFNGCKVEFKFDDTRGDFDVRYTYYQRIKIYNEKGMDVADQMLSYYKVRKGTSSERITGLEAFTFNLEGGKVVKEKLEKKNIFEEKLSDNYSAYKFAMPAVEPGSILEIQYTLVSPYYFRMDEFYFQKDYPVKYTEYEISIPEYYNYNQNVKGLVALDVQESKEQGYFHYKITDRSSQQNKLRTNIETIRYNENVKKYSAAEIESLKDEPFVYTMDNFKSSIRMELLNTQYPYSRPKYFTKTWDDIAEILDGSASFGKQLKGNYKAMNALLETVKDMEDGEKIATIYATVQDQFTWDSKQSKYANKGIKDLIKEGIGNSAEINLLLVNLLNKAGIQAYPMVSRARYSGNLNISNPSLADLDYVTAIISTETDIIYLDATDKNLQIDMLPPYALNLKGVAIIGDKGQELPIQNHNKGSESKVYALKIDGDKLKGTYKQKSKGYSAFRHRSKYGNSEDFVVNLNNDQASFENIEVTDFDNRYKPISVVSDVSLKGYAQSFDGKIFIDLMVGEDDFKNPFESETREFALFFDSKMTSTKMIKIEIPTGYQVESLPEEINIATPNAYIKYMLNPQVLGNEVVITIRSSINETIISPEYYESVRLLYDNIERVANEKIVLAKI